MTSMLGKTTLNGNGFHYNKSLNEMLISIT